MWERASCKCETCAKIMLLNYALTLQCLNLIIDVFLSVLWKALGFRLDKKIEDLMSTIFCHLINCSTVRCTPFLSVFTRVHISLLTILILNGWWRTQLLNMTETPWSPIKTHLVGTCCTVQWLVCNPQPVQQWAALRAAAVHQDLLWLQSKCKSQCAEDS